MQLQPGGRVADERFGVREDAEFQRRYFGTLQLCQSDADGSEHDRRNGDRHALTVDIPRSGRSREVQGSTAIHASGGRIGRVAEVLP